MNAKSIVTLGAIGCIGVVGAPSASAEVPDARCDAALPSSLIGDLRVAQTFTALNTGHLARFEAAFDNDEAPSTWTVQINTVDGLGKPTNATLAETTAPTGTTPVDEHGRTGAAFPNPAFVIAGTRYALVITHNGPDNFPMTKNGNPCPGEFFADDSPSGNWPFAYASGDLVFATFVEPPQPVPPQPSTILNPQVVAAPTGQRAAALKKCKRKKSKKARKKCKKRARKLPV